MGKIRAVYALIWISVTLNVSHSVLEECQQETERLRMQLKTLESRFQKQQLQIQHLRAAKDEIPANAGELIDLPGQTEYTDCAGIFNNGSKASGFYMIKPTRSPSKIKVYCDMSEGGGWTVLQRRTDGTESFERGWEEYKRGFGNMESAIGEFWVGNDNLHYLTSQADYNLRINMEDFDGSHRFAIYKSFKVSSEEEKYQLNFGEYRGNAGNALAGTYHPEVQWWASHQGMKFSTFDNDNDRYDRNCAKEDKSGWWFNRCHSANLNGKYYQGPYSDVTDSGIVWYTWHGWWYSLKSVVMKIRPSHFEPNEV
ncbi:hypothetical protein ACEWY4_026920 [Coilia grayii]|uniref:Fibrinogen-like protein 1 n=1 Tax=Coilia grayii TaxID=363190 RepID=A0ABD1IT83_9TELE